MLAPQNARVRSGTAARVQPAEPRFAGLPKLKESANACIEPGSGPAGDARIVVAHAGKLLEPRPPLLLESRPQYESPIRRGFDLALRAEASLRGRRGDYSLDARLLEFSLDDDLREHQHDHQDVGVIPVREAEEAATHHEADQRGLDHARKVPRPGEVRVLSTQS